MGNTHVFIDDIYWASEDEEQLLKQCEEEGSLIVFSRGYEHTAGYLERRKGSVELKPILV